MPNKGPFGLDELQLKHLHWEREQATAEARRAHDHRDAMAAAADEAAIRIGESTIRWAILINGGTAAGLLTFLASLEAHRESVANTLPWFAIGVLSGAVALAGGYLANFYTGRVLGSMERMFDFPYLRDGPKTSIFRKRRAISQTLAVGLFIVSIAVFVGGIFNVRHALIGLGDKPAQIVRTPMR